MVDCAELFRESTVRHLRDAGYDCQGIDSTEHARDLLAREHYDLLITDLQWGAGKGRELIEHAMTIAPTMPVVVVTEAPSLESAIQAVELPVVAYLPKSTPPEVLRDKIRLALAQSSGSRALQRLQKQLRQCADDLGFNGYGDRALPHVRDRQATRVPIATLQALAGCLGELVAIEQMSDTSGQVGRLCELLQCPVWRTQRNAIQKCIRLLHETKRRFKSKELAQVRDTLEGLLKMMP